jgi:hypothetical protein
VTADRSAPDSPAEAFEAALAETAEARERRGLAGAFYTPPATARFLCRLALADWLSGRLAPAGEPARQSAKCCLGSPLGWQPLDSALQACLADQLLATNGPRSPVSRQLVAGVVWADGQEDKDAADRAAHEAGLWPALAALLESVTVCDPACGCGAFLVEMLAILDDLCRRAESLALGAAAPKAERIRRILGRNLFGVELMAEAAAVCRMRLAAMIPAAGVAAGNPDLTASIVCGDALVGIPWGGRFHETGAPPGFDIVVGNPPYVRHERIGGGAGEDRGRAAADELLRTTRRRLAGLNLSCGSGAEVPVLRLDRRSDLYAHFFILALDIARAGGAVCFLTSDSWLDTEAGTWLQERLLAYSHVRAVIAATTREAFSGAQVNTVATLLRVSAQPSATALLTVLNPVHELSAASASQLSLAIGGLGVTGPGTAPTAAASGWTVVGATPLTIGKWGARYLRPTPLARRLTEHPEMVPLSRVVRLAYGCKPGLGAFFLLDREEARRRGLEPEFLRPVLSSVREIRRYAIAAPEVRKALFVCRLPLSRLDELGKCGAADYVRWGARGRTRKGAKHTVAGQPWPAALSVRQHRPEWHCLNPGSAGDFVIPCLFGSRFAIASNPDRLVATNMFFHGWFRALDPEAGLALLSSTVVTLMLELFGRTKGSGGLNLYGWDLGQVPVPSPELLGRQRLSAMGRLFSDRLAGKARLPIADELGRGNPERACPDRRALDVLVLEALGLGAEALEPLYTDLVELVEARLRKGLPASRP